MLEKFSVFTLGSLEVNSVLIKQDNHSVIIDPAGDYNFWINVLKKKNLILDAIYLTHGHFDHIEAVAGLVEKYNVPWFIHPLDLPIVYGNNEFLRQNSMTEIKIPTIDSLPLISGENQVLKNFNMMVYHTPGHTPGSCCFLFPENKLLLSGDTLFADTIGRTDFPLGDYSAMEKSIMLLKGENFSEDTEIIPGHGKFANIMYLKKYNVFFS